MSPTGLPGFRSLASSSTILRKESSDWRSRSCSFCAVCQSLKTDRDSAIFSHDGVAECTVFGVPDDRLGEEVGAAVVSAATPGQLSADELREFLRERLAAFKIPRYIWFLDDALPRNASGKFLKRELRERLDPADAH